jgi:hypothetical protein
MSMECMFAIEQLNWALKRHPTDGTDPFESPVWVAVLVGVSLLASYVP